MLSSPARTLFVRASVAVAFAAPLGLSAVAPADAAQPSLASMKKEVVSRVNTERKKAGCSPLKVNTKLEKAAQYHSYDMRKNNYFSHTSKDGRSPWQRIKAQGYNYGSAENIAAGQRTAKAVVDAWMKSPGHRKNILTCSNKAIGVGVSRGSGKYYIYWTQDFGRK